jgi:hypothetical protein
MRSATSNSLFVLKPSILSAATLLALIAGCGGGGSNVSSPVVASVPAVTVTSLSGVAATGAPMSGASIEITDAKGTKATKTAAADGTYSFDVSSMTAPFVINAKVQVGDTLLSLVSTIYSKPADGTTGTANVTPLTNAVAALLAPNGNPESLLDVSVLTANATADKVAAATGKINTAIENILVEAGLDPAKFNPTTTVFSANRQGADRVLELARVEISGTGIHISNPSIVDDGNGSASVLVTSANTPSKLPAPPTGTTLNQLDHFASLITQCFKDAPSVRVQSVDSFGVPTVLSAACAAVPFAANYKSGGFSAMERYQGILKSADLTGATFSVPERVFTYTDGNIFFKVPYKTSNGQGGILTDVARKTSPAGKSYQWEIFGNQRNYDSAVDTRIDNLTQLNPAIASESGKSQYRVGLRLFFNPAVTGGKNVQAVRVKGPGLPASGISMHRSNICGTNDYMTITSKTGSLVNSSNASILWNSGTANNFRFAAELKSGTLDWSKLSASNGWRDTAMSDAELLSIPPFAEYTFELWTFGSANGVISYRNNITNSTPPDVTYTQRLTSKPVALSALKTYAWNALNTSGFLNPQDPLAAGANNAAVAWTQTAEPVDYVNVFAQKAVSNNTTTANNYSNIRISADSSSYGISLNSRSASVSPAIDPAGTASLSGISGVTPSIPNCAAAMFPALDAVLGTNPLGADSVARANATYRDITLRSRAPSLVRKYATTSWSNFAD